MFVRDGRRLIVVKMHAGFAGTDGAEFYSVNINATEDSLSDFAWQESKNHAESYGIYPREEYLDQEDLDDEDLDSDSYSDNIEGWYEDYVPEEHDGLVVGSGGEPHFQKIDL